MADVWAWHVDPRTDRGGWPLHRGWYEDVRDAAGVPGLVNVWVLAHRRERAQRLHARRAPAARSPTHPSSLRDLAGLDALGVALPTSAGSALGVRNANVAHWGGTCDPTFTEPRISMSFTLRQPSHPAVLLPLPQPLGVRRKARRHRRSDRDVRGKELAPDRIERRWATMAVSGMRRIPRSLGWSAADVKEDNYPTVLR